MKKYNQVFPCYGQSVAGRINYYQKMGVADGIKTIIKREVKKRGLDLDIWKYEFNIGNGKTLQSFSMTLVIPTPNVRKEMFDYPMFQYNGKLGFIDMLCINGELQFHIMFYDRDTKSFRNGYWHTVREGLSLEDTCTLFEYVEDRQQELIILSSEDSDKYNSTGALGIGIQ